MYDVKGMSKSVTVRIDYLKMAHQMYIEWECFTTQEHRWCWHHSGGQLEEDPVSPAEAVIQIHSPGKSVTPSLSRPYAPMSTAVNRYSAKSKL